MVVHIHRIIQAIRIRVMPENALVDGEEDIGGNKPADFGVIVPALEVVEPGFGCFLYPEEFPSGVVFIHTVACRNKVLADIP